MSPKPRDDAQLGVRHTPHRVLLILRREVEVLFCGHHDCPGLDGGECLIVVAAEAGRLAYVAVLPGPQHTKEVVGVATVQEKPHPAYTRAIARKPFVGCSSYHPWFQAASAVRAAFTPSRNTML